MTTAKEKTNTVQLSPSRLNLLNECEFCFWIKETHKIKRGDSPMASIPRGIDRDLKTYYDQYRGTVTPEINGHVQGVLFGEKPTDMALLDSWRVWQKRSFFYKDKELDIVVSGAIDDCLIDGDVMIPLDYKTKSSTPKDNGSAYYQNQLDCYELFLNQLGFKTGGFGYLAYYWPNGVIVQNSKNPLQRGMNFAFDSKVYKLETSKERAKKLIAKGAAIIRGEIKVLPNPSCSHCGFVSKYNSIVAGLKQ